MSRQSIFTLLAVNTLVLTGVSCITVNTTSSPPATNQINTETDIAVGPSDDELADLAAQGQLNNLDYGFLIDAGTEHANKITMVSLTPFEGVTDTYLYCYETADTTYASADCPAGSVEIFRINVYTTAQYQAVQDAPFAGTMITEAAGFVYELAHPNGLLPEDVPANEAFYEAVVASFHFAG